MKLSIERERLLSPLQNLSGILERNQSIPILGHVLVSAGEVSVSCLATDMEIELKVVIEQGATEPGEITLPGRKLLDVCRALPSASRIDISCQGGQAVIRSGKSRFTLQTLPASEFPSFTAFSPRVTFDIASQELRGLLEETHFAMAQQDVRYYLNGLLLEIGAGRIRAVATDGHRLALKDIPGTSDVVESMQIIVPRKAVIELLKVLHGDEGEAKLSINDNHFQVHGANGTFTSKLIDGRYPDYEKVLPHNTNKIVIADRELLRQGLARSAILCTDRFKGVRISLDRDTLLSCGQNAEREESEEQIEVRYSDELLEVGFNIIYLIDALAAIKTAQVRLEFKDTASSCVIKPVGDSTNVYVVMPMRI
ncbi:MAG: DNA polymerase III subunit beta [Nitrososphaera sp.]|nr:DNA polymerase III subunit beta [Nitrososphaera sp.]